MSSHGYLDMMKDIHKIILNFLEDEAKTEENFLILEEKINNSKISDSQYDILSLLHLISKIWNNFHHAPNFFSKMERILLIFKEDIKKYFLNSDIFNIFKSNKRILLFLIEQQIIVFDEYIVKKITTTEKYIEAKYPHYFLPEIQPFINEKWFPKFDPENWKLKKNKWVEDIKKELPENFYEKRMEGENDSKISELIRKDMVKEFIAYINVKIQPSIYETNSFSLKRPKNKKSKMNLFSIQNNKEDGKFSLIEYAVFFGAIQIFNYLRLEGVELTSSLWPLAIHGQNAEIIHFLEDNHVEFKDNSCKQVFYESLKCHHIGIANYFINNFLQDDEENLFDWLGN